MARKRIQLARLTVVLHQSSYLAWVIRFFSAPKVMNKDGYLGSDKLLMSKLG